MRHFKLACLAGLPWLMLGLFPSIGFWVGGVYLICLSFGFLLCGAGIWILIFNAVAGKHVPYGGWIYLGVWLMTFPVLFPWWLGWFKKEGAE